MKSTKSHNSTVELLNSTYFVDGVLYSIIPSRKMVMIQEPEPKLVPSYFPLRGWFYEHVNLQEHIRLLSQSQFIPQNDGTRMFKITPPVSKQSADIFLNSQNHAVKFQVYNIDPKPGVENSIHRVESFQWDTIPEYDFRYPSAFNAMIYMRDQMVQEEKSEIVEIKINQPMPDSRFEVEYPDAYQINDNRKRKGQGGFGGFGGGIQ